MPNITLVTLGGIPGLDQAAMIQGNSNNCGAYATIAAVGAHRCFPMQANLAYQNAGPQAVNNAAAIKPIDKYPELSAAVYAITGILNFPTGMSRVYPELRSAGNVYNSPAAMAQAAIDLGRPLPQINIQPTGFARLSPLYPGERARCEDVVGTENFDVAAGSYILPGPDATHLVCVEVSTGGLHWVAQGSNGDFYDPYDGSLNNLWEPVNTGDLMGPNYLFAGLWLVIT